MADEIKRENKAKTSVKKRKTNSSIDKPTLVFFGIMIVGLIVLTIIILNRPESIIYSASYGEDFTISAEMYDNNDIDVAVDAKDSRVVQTGTYKLIDDDIDSNYLATFEDDESGDITEIDVLIEEDQLTLTYSDDTQIVLKEIKR